MLKTTELYHYLERTWQQSVIPTLMEYIKIPNKSPFYDPNWAVNGYMDQAVHLMVQWCQSQSVLNMQLEVIRHPDRTPLIYIDIPGNNKTTVLLYGHLDKQPEMAGWAPGLGPWTPVLRGDKLYGRGAGDDGYALFSALSAVKALQQQNIPHPRCVILIEACEESSSYDLEYYLEQLKSRIGRPSLVIGLDSGCGDYEHLWSTTSLRGIVNGTLTVEVLTEGVHSGNAGGIVPSCFLIARQLLSRIEDERTRKVINELHSPIPPERIEQAHTAAKILGKQVYAGFPFVTDALPLSSDLTELVLNRTWRPALSVIGAEGLPSIVQAGNVLLPKISLKLSLRLSPTCNSADTAARLQELLEHDPPYKAHVRFELESSASGWEAPTLSPWLQTATEEASHHFFGKPAIYMGEGGTIPFMGMLGEKYPEAQFLITGVLGPHANAHGPNEFLHIPTAIKLTSCVAYVIAKAQG